MRTRYWLLPVFMLVGTWLHTLICEQLPQDNELLPVVVTFLLFAATAFLLNRTCTRRTVLISATGLLIFNFVLAVLDLLLSVGVGSHQFAMGLAYLWEVFFFPYLSLCLLNIPFLHFILPALVPFAWAIFCKPSS